MKTVKFNPLHSSSAHLQRIHFLLAAKNVWKMNPNRDDMMRCEWRIKGIPIMLLNSIHTSTFTACNVRLWNNFLQLLHLRVKIQFPGLGFEMQNFSPEIGNQSVFRGSFRVSKGRRSVAIWVSAVIWYWYRISDDKELTHCALYHEQKPPVAWGEEVEYVQLSHWIKTWTRAAAASVFMATSKCLTIKRLLNMIYARMFRINGKVYLNTQHMCFV